MNRSKLTPCRKVGLSRKKNTPLKSVEGLLNERVNIVAQTPNISDKQASKKTATPNSIAKSEVNNDTPCRQVGLSRKRKTSTPIGDFAINKNESRATPSNNKTCKSERKPQIDSKEVSSSKSSNKKKIVEKIEEIPKILKSNEENHGGCVKKLSNLFSSPNNRIIENGMKCSQDPECGDEFENTSDFDQEKGPSDKNILLKSSSDTDLINVKLNEHSSENSVKSSGNEEVLQKNVKIFLNRTQELSQTKNCDKYENLDSTVEVPAETVKKRDDEDSNVNSQNDCQFIKVCYSNEREKTQSKLSNPKKPKFSRELFDDDDFEIGPKKKKKKFERSKTDTIRTDKKSNKNKLKKSLSVGDPKLRTLTDSSIKSHSSSLNLLNDCFVKLEPMKEPRNTQINLSLTPQDQSDDDFETFSCTPKETKIKQLDSLEKEVVEKRQILEELNRAKLHKRMHKVEDLKELTSRWKTGCVEALQDLLKQLNTHSQMTMELLLKKLNIPEDFVPLSQ